MSGKNRWLEIATAITIVITNILIIVLCLIQWFQKLD